jgi:hypothetical protein
MEQHILRFKLIIEGTTEKVSKYCIEGTEMRQLSFKVRRLLFLNRYWQLQRAAAIFILERKEGEIGK